jgi:hypothetical protein
MQITDRGGKELISCKDFIILLTVVVCLGSHLYI